MDIRKLSPAISVAAQISPDDVATLAGMGFRTIINNRPDHESAGQPESVEIEALAKAQGIEFHHQPVVSGGITENDIAQFKRLFGGAAQPVLAFCRTGTRCTMLWALSRAGEESADAIIAAAASAGYDVSALRARLETTAR